MEKEVRQEIEPFFEFEKNDTLEEKRKKQNVFRLPVSYGQIKELDEFLSISTLPILKDIVQNKEQDSIQKIESLLSIYQKQRQKERNRKNQLISARKRALEKIKDGSIAKHALADEYKNEIHQANIHMNILNNLINYLKHYQKNYDQKEKTVGKTEFQDEVPITPIQEEIRGYLKEGKGLNSFLLEDVIYSLGHYIKQEPINSQILDYATEIRNIFITEEPPKEMTMESLYYIFDAIRYRLSNTKKEEKNTRKLLKDIKNIFTYIVQIKQEDKKRSQEDLFYIIDYFLNHEEDYSYLKNLVKKFPKIVNTVHVDKESKEKEHIVVYIVKKFINHYTKMLENKKNPYISKDYLKNVYFLFLDSYYLHLTEKEKNQIDDLLSNFMRMVNQTLTSSRRKEAVKYDLKEMYTDKMYIDRKRKCLEEIDEYRLENQINSFFLHINRELNEKRVDLTNECSIKLGGKYHAYSIEKRENTYLLKIHVIDLYNCFIRNSELDKYLWNQTLINQPIDPVLIGQLQMIKGGTYPTFTYEIAFDDKGNYKTNNGQIAQFKIYKSKIQIRECYTDYHLAYLKGDIVLKNFQNLYRLSLIKNRELYSPNVSIDDMDAYFEDILNQGTIEYFQNHHLPFIYSGTKQYDEQNMIQVLNHISHILSRLEKDDFYKVYDILKNHEDEFHYSMEPFSGSYHLAVKNPLSYTGVMLQRILQELVLDNRYHEEEYEKALENYKIRVKVIIHFLNTYNDYMDQDILKEEKGKIPKVKKIIF